MILQVIVNNERSYRFIANKKIKDMKISSNFKTISKTFIAALALSAVMVSCSKDKNIVQQPISILNVIHASPTAEKLDFYVDNRKGNDQVSNMDFKYTDKTGYLQLFPGARNFTITKKGTTSPVVVTEKLSLDEQAGYSLFIIDKLETAKLLLLKDDLTLPVEGKARIRFVNLSPDAGAVDLAIEGKEGNLFTNKAFKEFSTFENIDAANKVTFKVKDKTTGDVIATLADVKIDSKRIYTIWVKGLKTTEVNDMKVGAVIFQH